MDTPIQIDPRDILLTDATIITGILILLTISAFMENKFELKFWGHPRWFITLALIPFVMSASSLLLGSWYDTSKIPSVLGFSIMTTVVGLIVLVIAVILTAISVEKNNNNSSSIKP